MAVERLTRIAVLLLCASCADSREMADSATATTAASHGTDGSGGESGDDAGDGSGELLDVGDGKTTAGDEGGGEGCKGIDFLFVVDNSGSMRDEQLNLTTSFPGFVQAIESKVAELGAADFQVLVTDTDSVRIEDPGAYCSLTCDGTNEFCAADSGNEVPCEFYTDSSCLATCKADMNGSCGNGSCEELMGCDACGCDLGAGKIDDMTGTACNVLGGQRYLQSVQPDLDGTFACLAEVGTGGSGHERQAGALVNALSPEATGAGGCNEGFVRDDAILVVTVITDEDEGNLDPGSPGDPASWYADVIAAKHGDPEAVVMLGLIGDGGQPGAVCPDSGNGTGMFAETLHELVTSFPRHVLGSVCEPNYATFFEQAVDIIKTTCEVYVPPQG